MCMMVCKVWGIPTALENMFPGTVVVCTIIHKDASFFQILKL